MNNLAAFDLHIKSLQGFSTARHPDQHSGFLGGTLRQTMNDILTPRRPSFAKHHLFHTSTNSFAASNGNSTEPADNKVIPLYSYPSPLNLQGGGPMDASLYEA
jgi:hypothetical protein